MSVHFVKWFVRYFNITHTHTHTLNKTLNQTQPGVVGFSLLMVKYHGTVSHGYLKFGNLYNGEFNLTQLTHIESLLSWWDALNNFTNNPVCSHCISLFHDTIVTRCGFFHVCTEIKQKVMGDLKWEFFYRKKIHPPCLKINPWSTPHTVHPKLLTCTFVFQCLSHKNDSARLRYKADVVILEQIKRGWKKKWQ